MRATLLLLSIAIPVSGCYSRRAMPVEELQKLDGFEAGDEVRLLYSTDFSESTPLAFVIDGVEGEKHRYVYIDIDGDQFVGWSTAPPAVQRVDLSQVDQIVVYTPQGGKVILKVILIFVGAVLGVATVVALVYGMGLLMYAMIHPFMSP